MVRKEEKTSFNPPLFDRFLQMLALVLFGQTSHDFERT
jgi:hypothetical protein